MKRYDGGLAPVDMIMSGVRSRYTCMSDSTVSSMACPERHSETFIKAPQPTAFSPTYAIYVVRSYYTRAVSQPSSLFSSDSRLITYPQFGLWVGRSDQPANHQASKLSCESRSCISRKRGQSLSDQRDYFFQSNPLARGNG